MCIFVAFGSAGLVVEVDDVQGEARSRLEEAQERNTVRPPADGDGPSAGGDLRDG